LRRNIIYKIYTMNPIHIYNTKDEYFIKIEDIIFVESDSDESNYVNFYLKNNIVVSTVRVTLKKVMELIEEQASFDVHGLYRAGRSNIINVRCIISADRSKNTVNLDCNGKIVGILLSRNAYDDLIKDAIQNNWIKSDYLEYKPTYILSRNVDCFRNDLPFPDEDFPKGHPLYDVDMFPNFVDLALPSGTLWADRNVALDQKCESSGDYFAWGETETRKPYEYEEEHYLFLTEVEQWVEEDLFDENKCLLSEYDVASQRTNGYACMPTVEDWQELIKYCKWVWCVTKDLQQPGVLVTSKINAHSIFLPAASLYIPKRMFNSFGTMLAYWSSTRADKESELGKPKDEYGVTQNSDIIGYACFCDNRGCDGVNADPFIRKLDGYHGLAVRPVKKTK